MVEITNRTRGPVQLMVRSGVKAGAFTTLSVPGLGAGRNVRLIEDEMMTEYVARAAEQKLISTRIIKKAE